MSLIEKAYSLFAIIFATVFLVLVFNVPSFQQLTMLLPLTAISLIVNIGLMFVVFKDIYLREFKDPNQQYIWFALILFVWPAVLIYLPIYGFKGRMKH